MSSESSVCVLRLFFLANLPLSGFAAATPRDRKLFAYRNTNHRSKVKAHDQRSRRVRRKREDGPIRCSGTVCGGDGERRRSAGQDGRTNAAAQPTNRWGTGRAARVHSAPRKSNSGASCTRCSDGRATMARCTAGAICALVDRRRAPCFFVSAGRSPFSPSFLCSFSLFFLLLFRMSSNMYDLLNNDEQHSKKPQHQEGPVRTDKQRESGPLPLPLRASAFLSFVIFLTNNFGCMVCSLLLLIDLRASRTRASSAARFPSLPARTLRVWPPEPAPRPRASALMPVSDRAEAATPDVASVLQMNSDMDWEGTPRALCFLAWQSCILAQRRPQAKGSPIGRVLTGLSALSVLWHGLFLGPRWTWRQSYK